MDWPKSCALVIPCLNEAATIASLIQSARAHLPTIIVIDDGSHDQTAALATAAGALVIRHPHTLGKGASLQTGWQKALALNFTWVLSMDGDGQHAPTDIPHFLACAQSDSVDLVIGNRLTQPAAIPPLRRFVNRWMSARISALAGQPLPDTQCGFRLMRLAAWQKVSLQTSHFEMESELLTSMLVSGFKVDFVPIQVIYKSEQSKIHPCRDSVRWFRWWLQTRARFRAVRRQ